MARKSGNKKHTPVNTDVSPIPATAQIVPMPGSEGAVPAIAINHEANNAGYNDMFVTVYIDLTRKKIVQMDKQCADCRKAIGAAERDIKTAVNLFVDHEHKKTARALTDSLEKYLPCFDASVEDTGKLLEPNNAPLNVCIDRKVKWYRTEDHSEYGSKEEAKASSRIVELTEKAVKDDAKQKKLMASVLDAVERRDSGREALRNLQRKIDRAEGEIANPAELRARANGTQYAKALSGSDEGKTFLDRSMEEISKQIEELYND